MKISESEKLIRTLYEITNDAHKGFAHQVSRLLSLGCNRFDLDIGILSRIEDNKYTVVYRVCPDNIPLNEGDSFELGDTYCSVTLQANKPVYVEHVEKSNLSTHPAYSKFSLESYIGIPIKLRGQVYGTLNFSSPKQYKKNFNDIDIDALQLMSTWLSSELMHQESMRRLEKANIKLKELASKDSLTNLNNRRSFHSHLEQQLHLARRLGNPLSFIMIDIDNFKKYNDKFGHLEGDQILISISDLLTKHSRGSDIVARIGGEEFAILLPNTDKNGSLHLANILQMAIHEHKWKKDSVTASIGVTTLTPKPEHNIEILELGNQAFKAADDALYYSKKNGRDLTTHYSDIRPN